MITLRLALMTLGPAMVFLSACGSLTPTASERPSFDSAVAASLRHLRNRDPGLEKWFDEAHGYAVFPSVGKAAFGIGGAHGRGYVYERGEHIGYARLVQVTIGLQLGGQSYRELIFFRDKAALERFKRGELEFAAQASAVAVTAGVSETADYSGGVAVFTLATGGLMYEASIGGQTFEYVAR